MSQTSPLPARGIVRSILESEQQQGTIRSEVDVEERAREVVAMTRSRMLEPDHVL
jgi:hypothetical protein